MQGGWIARIQGCVTFSFESLPVEVSLATFLLNLLSSHLEIYRRFLLFFFLKEIVEVGMYKMVTLAHISLLITRTVDAKQLDASWMDQGSNLQFGPCSYAQTQLAEKDRDHLSVQSFSKFNRHFQFYIFGYEPSRVRIRPQVNLGFSWFAWDDLVFDNVMLK